MNDDELFHRLRAADPYPDAVVLQPAHSARALSLKETIMTIDVESPATADDVITPDHAPGTTRFGGRRSRLGWLAGTATQLQGAALWPPQAAVDELRAAFSSAMRARISR